MRKLVLIVLALAASASLAVAQSTPPVRLAQSNTCYSNCAAQRATCERGCNAGGGSIQHVQACFVGCEQGQAACASRCRR